jgi:formate hydrogenlyase transcriptional activator
MTMNLTTPSHSWTTMPVMNHQDDNVVISLAQHRLRQPDSDFNDLLIQLLARFANCPANQIDREVHVAFDRVCELIHIERAGLWLRSNDGAQSFLLAHLYTAPHAPSSKCQPSPPIGAIPSFHSWSVGLGADSNARFPWLSAQAVRGASFVFSNVDQLPTEAQRDKRALGALGIRSGSILPILANGKAIAAASFALHQEVTEWPEGLVQRLKLFTLALANGMERKLNQEDLTVATTEINAFKALLDQHAIVTTTDPQGRITYANERFCAISKYSRGELLGQDHRIINSGHHSQEFFRSLWTTISQGQVWRGEIKNKARDGSFYWVAKTIVSIFNDQGKPAQYVDISTDITERKLAEETLVQSYAEIKQLKDRLHSEAECLGTEIKEIKVAHLHGEVIGRSQAIRRVLHQLEQVAPADCSVLITGETGTGKELIAQAIHRLSVRKNRRMVLVNCAALPAALVESELFGRERGAYTGALTSQVGRFEAADGSTIFLDEVGELSVEVQAKLLRVLQQGEFERLGSPRTHKVNVRLVAATNRDLAAEVRSGKFREDLYYRLKVFPIDIPPLRERIEDIPLLVFAFMEEFSSRMGKKITKLPRKTMETLQRYSWPGNIRELRNVVEHGVILTSGDTLRLSALGDAPTRETQPVKLSEVEREHILKTLESTGWRIKGAHGAAKRLDLQPSTLYSRMQKLGIPHRRQKDEMPTGS